MNYVKVTYCLFLLIYYVLPVTAEETRTKFSVEWNAVRGSRGYIVQYKREGSQKKTSVKVTVNRISLRTSPGKYAFRVAGLNKFGKPGLWSDWYRVKITEKAMAKSVKLGPIERRKDIGSGFWRLQTLVPGLPQIERGDRFRAYGYWFLYGGLGAGLYSERNRGNLLAHETLNDPVVLSLLNQNMPLETGLYFFYRRNQDEAAHMRLQNNQKNIGIAAVLLYLVHMIDATLGKAESITTFHLEYLIPFRFPLFTSVVAEKGSIMNLYFSIRF